MCVVRDAYFSELNILNNINNFRDTIFKYVFFTQWYSLKGYITEFNSNYVLNFKLKTFQNVKTFCKTIVSFELKHLKLLGFIWTSDHANLINSFNE